jgi:2,3-diketo-5-methylthio-1-phosphopentane phosphatase
MLLRFRWHHFHARVHPSIPYHLTLLFEILTAHNSTGHILFNNFGCGSTRREILDQQIHSGERSFRDVSEEMWGSLSIPFDDGFTVMQEALEIDPDFRDFHEFCRNNDIPFNVISAGLKPVLRKVLDHFLGEEASSEIDIVANDVIIPEKESGEGWKPVWLHDTELGHDKALSVQQARATAKLACDDGTIPLIVFIGDGVSDLPAAREADVLFARRGLRLEEYCVEHRIPYHPYDTFADIQKELIAIAKADQEKTKGEGVPAMFNPRANMWRRASSKTAMPVYLAKTPKDERMFVWPEIATMMEKPEGAAVAAPVA